MEWRQKMIDDVFGGNEELFDNAFSEAIDDSVYDGGISWVHLAESLNVLPELEIQAKDLISIRLGYLPSTIDTIAYEPGLRKALHDFYSDKIKQDDFYKEADRLIRHIRKWDLKREDCLKYELYLYEQHKRDYIPFGQLARARIIKFLGYEPSLEHSIAAELWLGSLINKFNLNLPEFVTPLDYRALTIIKYREVLLSQGKEAADSSPLLRCAKLDQNINQ